MAIEEPKCKISDNGMLIDKTILFNVSDIVFENGLPIRTKRNYRTRSRPKEVFYFNIK